MKCNPRKNGSLYFRLLPRQEKESQPCSHNCVINYDYKELYKRYGWIVCPDYRED